MNNEDSIGIFDSGIGGVTVLKEIIKILPNENYKYYSDSKNNPYGDKTDEEIIKICNKTFGTTAEPKNPTTNNIELFNEFLVQTVEEIVLSKSVSERLKTSSFFTTPSSSKLTLPNLRSFILYGLL